MSARKYVNNAPTTTIVGPINSTVTSFTVVSLAGMPVSFPYTATIDLGTSSAELVLVTGAVGSVPTVIRNYDGQGAFSHADGATFDHVAAAIDYTEANTHVNANAGVHGVAGSVVGTTDAQTLSSKTLTSPTINTPAINGGTASNAVNTGDATHAALIGKATTSGGKTLSLQNSSAVEKISADDAGNLTVSGAATVGSLVLPTAGAGLTPAGSIVPFAGISAPSGYYLCDGTTKSRTTDATLFAALSITFTANTTNGSLVLTGVSAGVLNALPVPGGAINGSWPVSGPGIPAGAKIANNGGSAVMTATATATASGVTLVVAPWGIGDGSTTFNLPNLTGRYLRGVGAVSGSPVNTSLGQLYGTDNHSHTLSGTNGSALVVATSTGIGIARNGNNFTDTNTYTVSGQSNANSSNARVNSASLAGRTDGTGEFTNDSLASAPSFGNVQYIIKS